MAVKRDIREEIKEQSKKDMFKNVKKIFKYIMSVQKNKIIKIFIIRLLLVFEPIALLFLLQNLINDAVSGVFNFKLIIAMAALKFIRIILFYFKQIFEQEYERYVFYQSSIDIDQKLVLLSLQDLENKELHNNYNRAATGIRMFGYYYRTSMDIIFNTISLISYLVILAFFNIYITAGVILFLSIFFYRKFVVLKENYIRYWEFTETKRKARYYSLVLSQDQYIRETKLLNADDRYRKLSKENRKKVRDLEIQNGLNVIESNREISSANALTDILFMGYLLYNVAFNSLAFGNFNTYRSAFSSLTSGVETTLTLIVDFQVDSLEMIEFFKFMEYESTFEDGDLTLNEINTIEFKDVYFKYKEDLPYVLNGISFKLEKGKNIALIGENGSGKTTVMKLIEKVYKPTKGEILINDININEYKTESLRDNVSILLQDYALYQESIKENILLNDKRDLSYDDLYNKIGDKGLVNKIKKMPEGLETILGNWFGEGHALSKGQMQKIALARVFVRKSNFLLLDEPNSALDPKSEREMFEYINKNKDEKTALVTLHIFTNIDTMDGVMMFEEGKIVAEGTHESLYGKNKKYTDFYNLQERDEELLEV